MGIFNDTQQSAVNNTQHSLSITGIEENINKEVNIPGVKDRLFKYGLDERATKSKLLKAAKRVPYEVDDKTNCSNMTFSDGSWLFIVTDLINTLEKCFNKNEVVRFRDKDMKVIEFKRGLDAKKLHVDTKVVLSDKSSRIVMHQYNSTQRITISGKGYREFLNNVLDPFFSKKVESLRDNITKYDKHVIESLGSKTTKVKRSNIKFRTSPGSVFSCNKCDFESFLPPTWMWE